MSFLFQSLTFISLGVLVYLVARALPRIRREEREDSEPERSPGIISSLTLERADAFVSTIFEKILRRLKILILRADNFVTASLGKVKTQNGDKGGKEPSS